METDVNPMASDEKTNKRKKLRNPKEWKREKNKKKRPKQLKLQDVNVLLSEHYGVFWKTLESLSFYKNVLDKWYNPEITENEQENQESENHEYCELQEVSSDLII